MSTIRLDDLDEVIKALDDAKVRFVPAGKQALWEGANIVANQVRANLEAVVKDGTGDLARSLYVAKMNNRGETTVETNIGFIGYDRNGVPNPLKANVLESGRSDQPGRKKTKFFSRAVNATREKAKEAIAAKLNEYFSKVVGD